MSEHQYVHFIALDKPLDEKQLEYMGTQSSRAEITKWDFTNEYHYGDFHGNTREMLRRGYDVHLHYANYGIRKLMFRLPGGLPWDRQTLVAYLPEDGVTWHADKSGRGGILEIQPEADAGTFDDDMFEPHESLEEIAPVRDLLIAGDLRVLYVIWLTINAVQGDDEATEPPLPAGMSDLPDCLTALADFYDLGGDILDAAAEGSPPMPKSKDGHARTTAWLAKRSKEELKELAHRFLTADATGVRAETLALIRDEEGTEAWPTVEPTRTFQQLREMGDELEKRRSQREADAKEKARRARLKKMAADPKAVIDEVEKLIDQRSTTNYIKAAKTLVELAEALGPIDGTPKAQAVAESLRKKNPTLKTLISELRKHGLLTKTK